uniref:No apical meristem-associated C-terminal domain-containing protein n=1 Tax=Brassica oleracea var. oleracea TaxID=109376 RepID=A0A0D3BN62_BRAOL
MLRLSGAPITAAKLGSGCQEAEEVAGLVASGDYEPKIVEIGYPHNMAADSLISSNEKILDLLSESTTSREKGHQIIELRLQNEAKKLAFKEVKEENKILLKNLASIDDVNIREYIRSEQERIIRKMRQEQQQQSSSVTQNLFGQYYGGSGANLPYY